MRTQNRHRYIKRNEQQSLINLKTKMNAFTSYLFNKNIDTINKDLRMNMTTL